MENNNIKLPLRIPVEALGTLTRYGWFPNEIEQYHAGDFVRLQDVQNLVFAARAAPSVPADTPTLMAQWRLNYSPEDNSIVVQHPSIGGYVATENSDNIASTILFHFASDYLAQPCKPSVPAPDYDSLRRTIHELRTYSPAGDAYHGAHVHKAWANFIEAAIACPAPAAPIDRDSAKCVFRGAEALGLCVGICTKLGRCIEASAAQRAVPHLSDIEHSLQYAYPDEPAPLAVPPEQRAAIHAKVLARGDDDHMIGPAFVAVPLPDQSKLERELKASRALCDQHFATILELRAAADVAVPLPASFPERDQSKPAEQQGLFRKFDVRRVDGSDQPGGKHYGCRYYVLDLTHDQHAPAAMRTYAAECAITHPQLAADLAAEFGAVPLPADQSAVCPACGGSGDSTAMSDASPDAYEVSCNCPHCGGSGALEDAYRGVIAMLEAERKKANDLAATLYFGNLAAGLAAPLPLPVGPSEQAPRDNLDMTDFIADYEWRTDEFCHTPTELEREMLHDFVAMMSEEFRLAVAPSLPVAVQQPTIKQLAAQLADDKPWRPAEQNAFAVFLAQFPNESSQGIISLGDAWKAGRAYQRTFPDAVAAIPVAERPSDATGDQK